MSVAYPKPAVAAPLVVILDSFVFQKELVCDLRIQSYLILPILKLCFLLDSSNRFILDGFFTLWQSFSLCLQLLLKPGLTFESYLVDFSVNFSINLTKFAVNSLFP